MALQPRTTAWRYLTGRGEYPWRCPVRTPLGVVAPRHVQPSRPRDGHRGLLPARLRGAARRPRRRRPRVQHRDQRAVLPDAEPRRPLPSLRAGRAERGPAAREPRRLRGPLPAHARPPSGTATAQSSSASSRRGATAVSAWRRRDHRGAMPRRQRGARARARARAGDRRPEGRHGGRRARHRRRDQGRPARAHRARSTSRRWSARACTPIASTPRFACDTLRLANRELQRGRA